MSRTLHLQMTTEFARAQIRRDLAEGRYPRWIVNEGGPAPVEEQQAYLDDLEARGIAYVPCSCSALSAEGRCLGAGTGS